MRLPIEDLLNYRFYPRKSVPFGLVDALVPKPLSALRGSRCYQVLEQTQLHTRVCYLCCVLFI